MMDNTITLIKQIRFDAALGKKKHFNAADRKEKYNHRISLSIAIISLSASSILFYSVIQIKSFYGDIVSFALVLLTMILSWVQIYFNWQKQAFEHKRVANKYLELFKTCAKTLSYIKDNLIREEDLIKKVEFLSNAISEINKDADTCPTNNNDYKLAKDGIESGEEEYTQKELSL